MLGINVNDQYTALKLKHLREISVQIFRPMDK